MNFEDALRRYFPRTWFRLKFIKYQYRGRGEPEVQLLPHLVERGKTAIDIGASVGLFAAALARHAGKVIAFEANPAVAAFARSVAPRNVEVINAALSSAAGRTTLRMPVSGKGNPITELATIAPGNSLHDGEKTSVEVVTQRLDDLAISDCGFIKIDVEGHEEAVLDGAAELISAQRPVLLIELSEVFNPGVVARVAAHFARLSYGGYFLSHGRLRPIGTFDAARDQDNALLGSKLPAGREYIANFIFVPDEKSAPILSRLT